MKNKTNIWDRLLEVLEADNLDEAAKELDINASTLRGRKARGAIPYKEIVHIMDSEKLVYVLKNERVSKIAENYSGSFEGLSETTLTQEINDSQELNHHSRLSTFEHFLIGLTQKIEKTPFSKGAKLQLINSLIRIAEQDLKKMNQRSQQSDPAPSKDN